MRDQTSSLSIVYLSMEVLIYWKKCQDRVRKDVKLLVLAAYII